MLHRRAAASQAPRGRTRENRASRAFRGESPPAREGRGVASGGTVQRRVVPWLCDALNAPRGAKKPGRCRLHDAIRWSRPTTLGRGLTTICEKLKVQAPRRPILSPGCARSVEWRLRSAQIVLECFSEGAIQKYSNPFRVAPEVFGRRGSQSLLSMNRGGGRDGYSAELQGSDAQGAEVRRL